MMRSMMLVSLLLVSSAAFAADKKEPAKFCTMLDKDSGFARCETTEVVCYVSGKQGGAQTCWVKQPAAPAPQASPAPAQVPAAVPAK